MNAEELIVPKERVDVEICSTRGDRLSGAVFLLPPRHPARGERLSEAVAGRSFLPLKTSDSTIFVATSDIAWIRIRLLDALDELDGEAECDDTSCTARVLVDVGGESRLEGVLRYAAPATARRLGDELERLPPLFPLRTPDWLYLVRTARVTTIVPLEENRS